MAGAIEHFKPLLIGEDPFRSEHIWQLLFRGGFFPAQRILTAAIAAVDIALWDIKGKALGVPVYELLGGRVRDRVLTYNHNNGETVEELVECCQQSVAEGWKALRWGLAHQQGDLLEPDEAVRLAITGVRGAAAGAGRPGQARHRCPHAPEYGGLSLAVPGS